MFLFLPKKEISISLLPKSINKYSNEIIDKWIKDPITNYKEIYYFFHDENELENDIYCLMESLMIKYGLSKFFDDPSRESKVTPYLIKRIKTIIIKNSNMNNIIKNLVILFIFNSIYLQFPFLKNLFSS